VIHSIIYEELCRGKILEASHQACIEIIKRMKADGAEGVILGCTELPLLIHSEDIDIPLFDTSRIHAEAAVKLALAE
jgi:aspartate racemase